MHRYSGFENYWYLLFTREAAEANLYVPISTRPARPFPLALFRSKQEGDDVILNVQDFMHVVHAACLLLLLFFSVFYPTFMDFQLKLIKVANVKLICLTYISPPSCHRFIFTSSLSVTWLFELNQPCENMKI